MTEPESNRPPPTAGFFQVVGAVLSAFAGIRKRQSADRDHARIKPIHIVVAGIIGGLLFIATLVAVVRFVVAR